MLERGGGVIDIYARKLEPKSIESAYLSSNSISIHVVVDVCEAMGANCVNTIAEGISNYIEELTSGKVICKICSNLALSRNVKASFCVPLESLDYKGINGRELAERIVKLNEWASIDPYRAATHNKGIMNGIDAVALATGQDWRAIESSIHTSNMFVKKSILPLTNYRIEGGKLHGEIELHLPVGVKGGVLSTNPAYKTILKLMEYPNSQRLSMIMASVGLAQNFAALRALSSEGIQKGHMALHARNIAVAAGCLPHLIAEVTAFMIEKKSINISAAKEYLRAHVAGKEMAKSSSQLNLAILRNQPSLLMFEKAFERGVLSVHIVFHSLNDTTYNLDLSYRNGGSGVGGSIFCGGPFHARDSILLYNSVDLNDKLNRCLFELAEFVNLTKRSTEVILEQLQMFPHLISLILSRIFENVEKEKFLEFFMEEIEAVDTFANLISENIHSIGITNEAIGILYPLFLSTLQAFEVRLLEYGKDVALFVKFIKSKCLRIRKGCDRERDDYYALVLLFVMFSFDDSVDINIENVLNRIDLE
jgi:hypothetical protein